MTHRARAGSPGFFLLVLASAALTVLALLWRAEPLRDLLCFEWPWRDLPLARATAALLPGLGLQAAGFFVLYRSRGEIAPRLAVVLFAASCLCLQVGTVATAPQGLRAVALRVESLSVTGYFTDAARIERLDEFVRGFSRQQLDQHSSTHPPGPILYYWCWLRGLGPERAAALGGWVLAALTAGVVPLIFLVARIWTKEARERATAAALWSMLPSVVAFTPEFDLVYPALTVWMLVAWQRVLAQKLAAAAPLGVALATSLFFAWNFLALGLFFCASTLLRLPARGERGRYLRHVSVALMIALGTTAAIYTGIWLAFGYDPVASFLRAMDAQRTLVRQGAICSGSESILGAPWDLVLGLGAVVPGLWIGSAIGAARRLRTGDRGAAWTLGGAIALASLLLLGHLPQEISRVWMFLQPLVVVPAAIALSRRSPGQRGALLLAHVANLIAVVARIEFIWL